VDRLASVAVADDYLYLPLREGTARARIVAIALVETVMDDTRNRAVRRLQDVTDPETVAGDIDNGRGHIYS